MRILQLFIMPLIMACIPACGVRDRGPLVQAPVKAENYGKVHFAVSCSPAAQQQFDCALAMLHSFYYPETVSAFTRTAEIDPTCAMAYWGIAISQRPNPLVGPWDDATLQRGLDAVTRGKALARTEREQEWLEALEPFFKDYPKLDQPSRTRSYEKAMAALHRKYPDDVEAAAFYALALNESASLADKTYTRQRKAASTLEAFAAKYPDHPGIAHYLIHSYDYRPLAKLALPAAHRYAGLAPSAPHAQHMPAHIYSVLGMWKESIAANQAALSAIEAHSAHKSGAGAHFYDFLAYAYLQLGQDRAAEQIVDRVRAIRNVPATSIDSAFAAPPARYVLERAAWQEASALQPRASQYPHAEAIGVFARALGRAHSGALAEARADIARLEQLREMDETRRQDYWAGQTEVLHKAASAWLALVEGNKPLARKLMNAAADLQDASEKHVAMENRLYPMRELLGYLLLELNDPLQALAEFEASLEATPNRLRGFYGAARAAELSGNRDKARAYYLKLDALSDDSDSHRPEFEGAKAFLSKQ